MLPQFCFTFSNCIVLYLWLNIFDRIYFVSNLFVFSIQYLLPQLFSAVSTGDLSKYNVATADLQLFWKFAVLQTFFIFLITTYDGSVHYFLKITVPNFIRICNKGDNDSFSNSNNNKNKKQKKTKEKKSAKMLLFRKG